MGMRKIQKIDAQRIVQVIKNWPAKRRLTWEALRTRLAQTPPYQGQEIWKRQSLCANVAVAAAWAEAKIPVALPTTAQNNTRAQLFKRVAELEEENKKLANLLETLRRQHTKLCYNASLLPGGSRVLTGDLPNNTSHRSSEG